MGDWMSNVNPSGGPIRNVGPVFYFKLKDDPVGDPKDTVGLVTNIKKTDGPRATWVNSPTSRGRKIVRADILCNLTKTVKCERFVKKASNLQSLKPHKPGLK